MNSFGWGSIVGLNIFLPMYLQSVIGPLADQCGPEPDGADGDGEHVGRSCGQFYGRMTHYKIMPMIGLLVAIAAIVTLAVTADRLTPLEFELLLAADRHRVRARCRRSLDRAAEHGRRPISSAPRSAR